MKDLEIIGILGLIFGSLGTALGGAIGAFWEIKSAKILGFILEFAAGLMTSIICFDLIPKSLSLGNITVTMIGIIIGIFTMVLCDNTIQNSKKIKTHNKLLETGLIILIGLTIHNLPEGLAIGSGFEASSELGLSLAIAICIHDVPEGISIALPLKQGGSSKIKAFLLTAASGITTGIGAFLGAFIANISGAFISFSLSFAAGAMLYIVSCELLPESKHMYKGRFPALRKYVRYYAWCYI